MSYEITKWTDAAVDILGGANAFYLLGDTEKSKQALDYAIEALQKAKHNIETLENANKHKAKLAEAKLEHANKHTANPTDAK